MQISDNDYTRQISAALTRKNKQNNTLNFVANCFLFQVEPLILKQNWPKIQHTHEQDTHTRNKNQYIWKYKHQIHKP